MQRTTCPALAYRTVRIPTAFMVAAIAVTVVSCIGRDEEDTRAEDASRDLLNNATTFIYNAIPNDPGAAITPEYSTAINRFSVNLLQHVYGDTSFTGSNVVLSPFSVSRSLSVLADGAVGQARSELLEALGGQSAIDDARSALSELLYADNSIILQCADALWIDSTRYALNDSFRANANSKFGVECAGLDFSDRNAAVAAVNNWISSNTNNYLTDVVRPEIITPYTVLLLTNAISFEADWTSPFDVTATRPELFSAPGGAVEVDMMNSQYYHQTRIAETYDNARIYYGTVGADYFYLDVYMPTSGSIEDFLSDRCLVALSDTDSVSVGLLQMPKFSFRTEVDLAPVLRQLGIVEIFDPYTMDLAGIAQSAGSGTTVPIYVESISHTAGIETDEEGTKAVAVTVVSGGCLSAGPPSPNVTLDKPFVYFIRAGQNGLVLFAGVVNNPNQD